jgi:hypothetical protein
MSKKKLLKYFELPIEEIKEWGFIEYIVFVLESLYSTVFPFFAGMLLVYRKELVWILMLILPIYFKLNIEKKKKSRRRIYIK